jgi:hypothetical protein
VRQVDGPTWRPARAPLRVSLTDRPADDCSGRRQSNRRRRIAIYQAKTRRAPDWTALDESIKSAGQSVSLPGRPEQGRERSETKRALAKAALDLRLARPSSLVVGPARRRRIIRFIRDNCAISLAR